MDDVVPTVSRPFARPDTGKIAVKVINDYDDEVMQVVEVARATLGRESATYPPLLTARQLVRGPLPTPAVTGGRISNPLLYGRLVDELPQTGNCLAISLSEEPTNGAPL